MPHFVNLTSAYNTVWHRGLTCKLLRLLPDKHMVRMIMKRVRNRGFTITTGDSKQSRLRGLKNGVSQGSVLDSFLFNINTYDLPPTISRKFACANHLALLHFFRNWKDLKGTLRQDITTLLAYIHTWRLKLSHTKTVTAILPELASAFLNGQITNGMRSTVKILSGSVFLCSGPVPSLLEWACPEELGLSLTV